MNFLIIKGLGHVNEPLGLIEFSGVTVDFFDDGGVVITTTDNDSDVEFSASAFEQIVAERGLYLNRIKSTNG